MNIHLYLQTKHAHQAQAFYSQPGFEGMGAFWHLTDVSEGSC